MSTTQPIGPPVYLAPIPGVDDMTNLMKDTYTFVSKFSGPGLTSPAIFTAPQLGKLYLATRLGCGILDVFKDDATTSTATSSNTG